ncbi:MAG: hypothetical protein QOG39_986 [Acidimicrobiaceae bacterium]
MAMSVAAIDVVVLGAGSGGVGAAVGAARKGARVLVIEPSPRVGGMLTNGVTADVIRPAVLSGLFDELRRLVAARYVGHPDAGLTRDGLYAEPDVVLAAVRELLTHPNIEVRPGWRLVHATTAGDRVSSVTVTDGTRTEVVQAAVLIDATPEGDLLGAVGVEGVDWVVGREGSATYGEPLAPPTADRLQQAYTYRLTVQVGGRTDYSVPSTYPEDRPRYATVNVGGDQRACTITDSAGVTRTYRGMRLQRCLPDRKMDVNIDLIGFNHDYPTATRARRTEIEGRLAAFVLGYLHWLRTERAMPELGLPVDDYTDNHGFPSVLYVREGRRMLGRKVFSQGHVTAAPGSDRPRLERRSVAIGEYGMDSHCVGPRGAVSGSDSCEGGFWVGVVPYQVPFDVMVPRRITNLLVPEAVSASHVAYSTLRIEVTRMNLGFAAGMAAAGVAQHGGSVGDVNVRTLQLDLVAASQALIYFDDLPTSDRRFRRIQVAATAGNIALPVGYHAPG